MKTTYASVPGKVMLAGEYAVLRGGTAMACTISSNMLITARASASQSWEATSDLFEKKVVLDDQPSRADHSQEPLIQVLSHLRTTYPNQRLHLGIQSHLNVSYGVGSSSALRYGCLLAANAYASGHSLSVNESWDVARTAFELQQHAQNFASGYDIATQCKGGLTVMRNYGGPAQWPGLIAHIASGPARLNQFSLVLVGGTGAPTTSLTASTLSWLDKHRQWDHLLDVSEDLVDAWTSLMTSERGDTQVPNLVRAIIKHRNFFTDSPAAGNSLMSTLRQLPDFDDTWTCKTTGAGGEDALLLVGPIEVLRKVAVTLAPQGWHAAPFSFIECSAAVTVTP